MNQKENFVSQLIEKTRNNEITWTISNGDNLANLIPNANLIIRTFSTSVGNTTIVFVEQKLPRFHEDLDNYYEHLRRDIYIIEFGLLQTSIAEEEVSGYLMQDLYTLIQDKQDNGILTNLLGMLK